MIRLSYKIINLKVEMILSFENNEKLTIIKPVAQRHQMVSGYLSLLRFNGLDIPLGSWAAAPIGDKVL